MTRGPVRARWEDIKRRYECGEPLSVLSRELGCGKAAVARNLRIMGVSIRGRGGDNRFSVEARRRKCSFGTVQADISNAE